MLLTEPVTNQTTSPHKQAAKLCIATTSQGDKIGRDFRNSTASWRLKVLYACSASSSSQADGLAVRVSPRDA
jgi:hypothetical protein